jgi:hypothetical protein
MQYKDAAPFCWKQRQKSAIVEKKYLFPLSYHGLMTFLFFD